MTWVRRYARSRCARRWPPERVEANQVWDGARLLGSAVVPAEDARREADRLRGEVGRRGLNYHVSNAQPFGTSCCGQWIFETEFEELPLPELMGNPEAAEARCARAEPRHARIGTSR